MPAMSDTNPHDALVRNVFSEVENAAGLFRSVLPKKLSAAIDWPTLRLENTSFVDPTLNEFESDLLYTADLGGRRIALYLLFEHQSTGDPLMPFRVLRYKVLTWDGWLKDHPHATKLPPIVAIVLSHASGGWRHPTSMHEVIDMPEELRDVLEPYLPSFTFVLDDLMRTTDDELKARAMKALGKIALLMLRHARGHRIFCRSCENGRDWCGKCGTLPTARRRCGRLFATQALPTRKPRPRMWRKRLDRCWDRTHKRQS